MKTQATIPTKTKKIQLFSFVRFNIWFFAVAICSVVGRYHILFFSAFSFAAIHELAHVLCAKTLNVPVSHITVFPFGLSAHLSDGYIKNPDKEFLISFAGPFLNIILFWIFNSAYSFCGYDLFRIWADINLAMCSLNLIPILPLDGGRMLKSVLLQKYGSIRVHHFMIKLSGVLLMLLIPLSLVLFVITRFNFTLTLICAFLFHNLNRENISLSHNDLKEIIQNNSKLDKASIFPTKTYTVKEHNSASNVLHFLSHDRFCIFFVIDKKAQIIKTLTETEILNALIQRSSGLKFGEI